MVCEKPDMDFSDLYRQHAQDIFGFALFPTGNRALAEDLTAETFARALVAKDDIRVGTVKAYLLAIARNLYRDLKRRDGRLVPLDEAGGAVDHATRPDAAAEEQQRLGRVVEAVQRLPEGEREALVLAVQGDLSYERIAAILGCSVAAVKVRVHRARARLRSVLDQERAFSPRNFIITAAIAVVLWIALFVTLLRGRRAFLVRPR
jgi:RNA polymerase sigma-70 factor, ECF subfamily